MNDYKLNAGNYKSNNNNNNNNIIINVKETEKSYILKFISYNDRYEDSRIDMMFKNGKCIINKLKSRHAMRIWSNKDFTIYPFQDGIPYYFELIED